VPYAFNLTLDPESSLQIERIYADLAALDIPDHDLVTQYGPCVTILVVADEIHADDVRETLARQLPATGALPVSFTEPCIILGRPPTLSLRVSPTGNLLALHNAIYNKLPEQAVHLQYRPAYWQPHLKLANIRQNQAASAALVATVAAGWRRLDGVLDRLEVIQYPPVEAIWQAPLKRPATLA